MFIPLFEALLDVNKQAENTNWKTIIILYY